MHQYLQCLKLTNNNGEHSHGENTKIHPIATFHSMSKRENTTWLIKRLLRNVSILVKCNLSNSYLLVLLFKKANQISHSNLLINLNIKLYFKELLGTAILQFKILSHKIHFNSFAISYTQVVTFINYCIFQTTKDFSSTPIRNCCYLYLICFIHYFSLCFNLSWLPWGYTAFYND